MPAKTVGIYPYMIYLDVLGAMLLFVNWSEIFRGSSECDQRGKYERAHAWRHQNNKADDGQSVAAYRDENTEKPDPKSCEGERDRHPSQGSADRRKSQSLSVAVTRPVHKLIPRSGHRASLRRRVDTPWDLT